MDGAAMSDRHQGELCKARYTASYRNWITVTVLCCVFLLAVGTPSPVAAKSREDLPAEDVRALLEHARQLVLENRMEEAFQLLAPHELQLAGNPDYDYLLGTAAVDTGRPDLSIFALERVLAEKPTFAGARLELARAYFDIGDNETARYHFDYLLGQNPPPNVQQAISSYLRAIDRVAGAYRPIHIPHFAAGFGWDSNANASTAVEQFLGFVLDGNNVETDSPYYFATLGDYYSHPLNQALKLVLKGSVGQRNYPDASFVDSTDVEANAGLEWNFGDTRINPSMGAALNWLDGDDNLDRYTFDLDMSHSLNDTWKLLGGLTAAAHRFTGELDIQDVDVYNARAGVEHYLDPQTASVISLLAMVGTDDATDSNSPFGNDRWALQVSGSRSIAPGVLLSLNAGARNTDFDGTFFGVEREDDQWNATLSMYVFDWPGQGWRVIGQVGYTDVDSTIDLYTYDRTLVGLTFHRAFE
jgi:tetratricopeptide (TPR) repeat protein